MRDWDSLEWVVFCVPMVLIAVLVTLLFLVYADHNWSEHRTYPAAVIKDYNGRLILNRDGEPIAAAAPVEIRAVVHAGDCVLVQESYRWSNGELWRREVVSFQMPEERPNLMPRCM